MSLSLDSFDESLKQLKTYANLQFHGIKINKITWKKSKKLTLAVFSNFNLPRRKSEDKRDFQNTQKRIHCV